MIDLSKSLNSPIPEKKEQEIFEKSTRSDQAHLINGVTTD